MKLLFISRKFPPMVGGLENLNFALAKEFKKNVDTTVISWGRSQKWLPYFLPVAFLKALYYIPTKRITNIHLGDGLLSPLGLLLKWIFGIKTTVTIAGLDITWKFAPYQWLVPKCVARLDKVICISNATLEECVKRGIPRSKCVMIPCGVYPEEFQVQATRADLEKIVGKGLRNKKVIITVGRLVPRKGVYWFIEKVFPQLDSNYEYLVIGSGEDKDRIETLVDKLKLQDRIHLLGRLPDDKLKIVYNTADVFVMPNINVAGNMEGFGIVAIEAGAAGLPVIASDTEGIRDAVINKKTGELVQPNNSQLLYKALSSPLRKDKNSIKTEITKIFAWPNLIMKYIKML